MRVKLHHNMEVAHRLSLLPGKCQQIHGHSMLVTVTIEGSVDKQGLLEGLDFGLLKKQFRAYIDSQWDHQLHLNVSDEWAGMIYFVNEATEAIEKSSKQTALPGLVTHPGDPTVENIAMWIGQELMGTFSETFGPFLYSVEIRETATNSVVWKR